jgi:hypothetical protein
VKHTASIVALALLTALAHPALAQEPPPSSERSLPGTGRLSVPGATMSASQEAALTAAIQDVYDDFEDNRVSSGIGNLIGGLIIAGLGGFIAYSAFEEEPRDLGVGLLGLGVAGIGLNNIVTGIWDLSYATPQEHIAGQLLENPAQLRASGMFFLEHEAYRARRARLVGGTLSIMSGAVSGVLLVPLLQGGTEQDTILLMLLGLTAGLQVLDGIITLFGTTAAEQRYEELEDVMSVGLDVSFSPTVMAIADNERTRVGPGFVLGGRF